MAKRKSKKKSHHKKKHHSKPRAKSGKSKSRSKGKKPAYSLDTVGKMFWTSIALRGGSGLVYFGARKYWIDKAQKPEDRASREKALEIVKVALPAAVTGAGVYKVIPHIDGLVPMALNQAVNAGIDAVQPVKDIFDFKFLDSKNGTRSGTNARSFLETARQLSNTQPLSRQPAQIVGEMPRIVGKYEKAGYEKAGYEKAGYKSPMEVVMGHRSGGYQKA